MTRNWPRPCALRWHRTKPAPLEMVPVSISLGRKQELREMIPQPVRNVNTPVQLDSLFDGDARLVNRAERLAMTAAEMIRAAENRYHHEYMLDLVHQGGYNRVEVVMPYADPNGSPWVHLLPVGWRETTSGSWMRTYLVRGNGAQYGAPDWAESENMHEWLTAGREDTGGVMTEMMP